ncbi:hypothetical protein CAEBREN_09204 [Caenorhabditis brenneri]|uniref:DUF38 domain-containing protein n=1 Tax=Caenorhabditis brenneri TaxID=135651 RepID=G0NAI9_CAEBE|nr:hypothetical protein CAEBREN_09204 [Caenorhabditis brenneri]
MPASPADRALRYCILQEVRARDVSRDFRALVDNKAKVFKDLSCFIQFNQGLVEWCIGSTHCFMYEKVENGSKITSDGKEIFVNSGDYLKEFVTQFGAVIANSKLEISEFRISSENPEYSEDFGRFNEMLNAVFKSLNHKIHIESAHFENVWVDTVHHILFSSKPGTLEIVLISSIIEGQNLKFADVAELEQWKRATDLSVYTTSAWNLTDVPIDNILHAEEFSYSSDYIAPNELVRVREILFQSPNFKKGIIEFPTDYDFFPVIAALGQYMKIDTELPNYQYYRFPGSNETMLFQFDTYDDSVLIEKFSMEETN